MRLNASALFAATLPIAPLAAQEADSVAILPEIGVTVTRTGPPGGSTLSLTRLNADTARRGRPSPTLDELLGFVPGVIARERPDRSLDTRIVIRGAGARANFGVRGVRVLVDGVPATLPDGQTPLTTIDLELAERVEVARGPLAALHGNGSLGVVGLTTPARFANGLHTRGSLTLSPGDDRAVQLFAAVGGGGDNVGGLVAVSRLHDRGVRQHSRAEQWRLRGGAEWQVAPATVFTLRGQYADDPVIEAPGALTLTEFADDPTRAAPTSLLRNAGKSLSQRQLAASLRHGTGGSVINFTAWTLWRSLENPIAAPAPAPAQPSEGTWIGLDRRVMGARGEFRSSPTRGILLSTGLDVQSMRDERVNRRHDAGDAEGPAFLDQRERIAEVGGFAQLIASLSPDWSARVGVRHDRVKYDVADRIDSAASGARTMSAWSAAAALGWQSGRTSLWLGIGNAFETPTSTELANSPDGSTGLNRDLQPTRTTSAELGMRTGSDILAVELVAFTSASDDAITPIAEVGGRSFYDNIGSTTTLGAEMLLSAQLQPGISAHGTLTLLRARFGDDARDGEGVPVAGNYLPGVTPITARVGVTARHRGVLLDIDHGWSRSLWADDANTIQVPGWGPGVTNLLVSATVPVLHGARLQAGVRNLFDRAHALGVVVNGGFGRVVEPGGARRLSLGLSW